MSLDSTLSIASSGLDAVSRQLSLVSQNVANASTPGYAEEALPLSSAGASGLPFGVRSGPAQIDVDAQLQAATWRAQSAASAANTTNSALSAIDQVAGSTGSSTTIADQLGALENQISSLEASPSSQVGQYQVVAQAEQLANAVGQLASAGATQRQGAQDALVNQVGQLNQALDGIGTLSAQIVQAKAQGQSTADLEQSRNKQMSAASSLLGIQFVPQGNGGMQAIIGGIAMPLDGTTGSTFEIDPAQLAPDTPASAVPGITLGGLDVTAQLAKLGGSIGANLQLRDQAMPQMQAELDEFSYTLASSFAAQGLALFTDGSGKVPTNGGALAQSNYVGLAQSLQVNPAVVANPALVQQGTGSASSDSGSTAVLQNVLEGTFGTLSSPPAVSGLGVSGTITARFATPTSLASFAASIGAAQAQGAATASSDAETEQATATAMQNKLSAQSGVSIDTELSHMVALQNAYSANARVLTAANSMMSALLAAVQP